MRKWLPVLLAAVLVGAVAIGQNVTVNQGAPGNYGPWPVTVSGGIVVDGGVTITGTISTTPALCTTSAHKVTSVSGTAVNCPGTQLTGRRYVWLCNSLENTGTPIIKIRVDGTSPVIGTGTAGDVLNVGDCITYAVGPSVVPQCISNASGVAVDTYECQ